MEWGNGAGGVWIEWEGGTAWDEVGKEGRKKWYGGIEAWGYNKSSSRSLVATVLRLETTPVGRSDVTGDAERERLGAGMVRGAELGR
jgi:hypothetical protein